VHLFFFRVDEEGRLVADDEARQVLNLTPGRRFMGTLDEEGRLIIAPANVRPWSEAEPDDEEDWSDLPEGEAPSE
jgi:bifunctional DNA-binding transcriptional regulator/antitoxin component of YhaV-PrlF toxin-antitoxin module